MKLIHYASKEFELEIKKYSQEDSHYHAKPNGLWVSIEGKYDWKWWCEAENFRTEFLLVEYEVKLKRRAKILRLKTEEEVKNLANLYPFLRPQWQDAMGRFFCRTYEIDWKKVKEEYQGIIIAPYQWPCRLANETGWYYGWDCASGCIWDLTCIKEFKLRKGNNGNCKNGRTNSKEDQANCKIDI